MMWTFALNGGMAPLAAPAAPPSVVTFAGPLVPTNRAAIEEYAFGPQRITVPVGSTVTWTNTGDLLHTATDVNHGWDTGPLLAGESASLTFDTPGTYTYVCAPHPWMMGQLVVVPADAGESAAGPGS